MNSEREKLIANSKSPQLCKLNNRQKERERERERERVQMHENKRYQSLYSLSRPYVRLMHNWLDDDANCIIVTIGHKCSPVDSCNCFPRVLGICADRPMTAGENSLTQRCVSTGTFFKKRIFTTMHTLCKVF